MIYFILFLVVVFAAILITPQLKGWRTQVWASLVAGIPILSEVMGYLNAFRWEDYVTKDYLPFIVIGIGVSFAILRKLTTTPVGKA